MADQRERWDDLTEVLRTSGDRTQARIWTSLPVKVVEDSDGFTVKLQPLIQGKRTDQDGKTTDQTIPPLLDVPVQFSAGGGFTITHPVKKDDEGIAIFSARCIDNWWGKGDVQPQAYQRWHDLSDAMYIPGIRSKPRKLGGPDEEGENDYRVRGVATSPKGEPASTKSVQIRTDDGKYYIELTDENVVIVCKECTIKAEDKVTIETKEVLVKASDKVRLETPKVEITGELNVDGDIRAGGEITGRASMRGSSISLTGHKHGGVRSGGELTHGPVSDT